MSATHRTQRPQEPRSVAPVHADASQQAGAVLTSRMARDDYTLLVELERLIAVTTDVPMRHMLGRVAQRLRVLARHAASAIDVVVP